MFFGMCIYETLAAAGKLDSIIIAPSKDSPVLITDRLSNVGPKLSRDVNIGPLRFYTDECGLSVRTATSRLRPPAFRVADRTLEFRIEHMHWPARESHAGYYILLLPPGFGGTVHTSAQHPEIGVPAAAITSMTAAAVDLAQKLEEDLDEACSIGKQTVYFLARLGEVSAKPDRWRLTAAEGAVAEMRAG